jgi:multicomponent Na+:H+ antiporter subunit G
MTPVEILIVVLAAAGTFFAGVAVVGLLRLPDLYTRAHSASKSDTLGAVLSLGAVAITFGTGITTLKTVLLLVFMFITNPTAAHAITRAAHDQGIEPWTKGDRSSERDPTPDADAGTDPDSDRDRDRGPGVGAE